MNELDVEMSMLNFIIEDLERMTYHTYFSDRAQAHAINGAIGILSGLRRALKETGVMIYKNPDFEQAVKPARKLSIPS